MPYRTNCGQMVVWLYTAIPAVTFWTLSRVLSDPDVCYVDWGVHLKKIIETFQYFIENTLQEILGWSQCQISIGQKHSGDDFEWH